MELLWDFHVEIISVLIPEANKAVCEFLLCWEPELSSPNEISYLHQTQMSAAHKQNDINNLQLIHH